MHVSGGHFGDNQLHIGLADLIKAEQQGKWWLVGSAWAPEDQAVKTGIYKLYVTTMSLDLIFSRMTTQYGMVNWKNKKLNLKKYHKTSHIW